MIVQDIINKWEVKLGGINHYCSNRNENTKLLKRDIYKEILDDLKQLDEPQVTNEQAWNKIAEAYPESAQSLRNTLDNAVFSNSSEPQKHVMPKFFDKWAKLVVEEHDKFYAISLITRVGWGYGVSYELDEHRTPPGTKELLDWIVDYDGDVYPNKKKAVEALLYGYEVEKEPSWVVAVHDGEYYFTRFMSTHNPDDRFSWDSIMDKSRGYHFDDKEMAEAVAKITGGEVVPEEVTAY